jgi:hypothetical protein
MHLQKTKKPSGIPHAPALCTAVLIMLFILPSVLFSQKTDGLSLIPVQIACPVPVNPYAAQSGQCFRSLTFTATATGSGLVTISYFVNTLPITFPYNFPVGSTTVTAVAIDAAAQTAECSFTVVVIDTENPVITCPTGTPFFRGTDPSGCSYEVQGTEFDPSVTDNCTGTTLVNSFNGASTLANAHLPVGSTVITWTATDPAGHLVSCLISVNVTDNDAPVVACPPNISVGCPSDIPEPNTALVVASDNCGVTSVVHVIDEYVGLGLVAGFCPTSVNRTYRATDAAGNFTDCIQVITVLGQCGCALCQTQVPHFWVNLNGSCDSVWTSPSVQREGKCCDANGSDRCVSFSVKIDNNAIGFYLLMDGAAPPGHYYQVDCGPHHPLSDLICIPPGGAYHTVTICKPGANNNVYQIQSVCGLISPDSISTRANCARTLTVSGVEESTITWNDITGGGAYNSYLSCTAGCYATTFTPDSLAPPIIKYLVCGVVTGNVCAAGGIVCDTVEVYVYPEISIAIYPDPPTFCIYDPHTIYASVTPSGSYSIKWWDGPNGTGNVVSTTYSYTPPAPGQFSITVSHLTTTLPCSEDTLNFEILLGDCILNCPEQYHCKASEIVYYSTVGQFVAAGGVLDFPYSVPDENIMLINQVSDNNQCPETIIHTWLLWDILGNSDICDEVITLNDTIPPVFTENPDSVQWCVQDMVEAFWNFAGDITPVRPDWHTFYAGNTLFDLDPETFSDNCTPSAELALHWQIQFAGGGTLTGSGQPSSWPSNIIFPLGINYVHYWLTDNCGNITQPSDQVVVTVIVYPRPDIFRNF